MMLAVTGLIMLWSAVFFGRDGEKYYAVTPSATQVALSQQADAARALLAYLASPAAADSKQKQGMEPA